MQNIFVISHRLFFKMHHMNHLSFLYILTKLHAKITENKQDVANRLRYSPPPPPSEVIFQKFLDIF